MMLAMLAFIDAGFHSSCHSMHHTRTGIVQSMVSNTLTSEPSTSNETKSKYATPTARSSCPNGADGTW